MMGKHRFARNTQRFASLEHAPCVYVAELSTGVVKVGVSSSARARLMSLANEVKRAHAAELNRFHVATHPTVQAAYATETKLVQRLQALAKTIPGRREFFIGLSFRRAVIESKAARVAAHTERAKA